MLKLKEEKAPLKLHKEQADMVSSESVDKVILEIENSIASLKLLRDWLLGNL